MVEERFAGTNEGLAIAGGVGPSPTMYVGNAETRGRRSECSWLNSSTWKDASLQCV